MLRSLYSGVSGLQAHQIRMDVIGNNIANVNTIGYKKSRVNFSDTLYQSMKGSSAPTANLGGINGQSVGLGTTIASIDTIVTSGSTQTTNKMSDLMIQGNGYFILKGSSIDKYYTRAGNFEFDPTNKMINTSNGMQVMGYMYNPATGEFSKDLTTINVSGVKKLDPKATTGLLLDGNLDSGKTPSDDAHPIPQDVYDSLGNKHSLVINMSKSYGMVPAAPTGLTFVDGGLGTDTIRWTTVDGFTDPSDYEFSLDGGETWATCTSITAQPINAGNYLTGEVQVRVKADTANGYISGAVVSSSAPINADVGATPAISFAAVPEDTVANMWKLDISLDGTPLTPTGGNLYVTFNTSGRLIGVRQDGVPGAIFDTFTLSNLDYANGTAPGNITLDFTGLTQYGQDSTAWAGKTDPNNPDALGYPGGNLTSYTIDQSGIITGIYSNDVTRQLAQLAMATFDNAAGLRQIGSNLFQVTNNSGAANEGKVGTGDRGTVSPGTLEMSNVDLSEEFTNMIVTQRGFQANSRIITTSDQMLEELLSLKR